MHSLLTKKDIAFFSSTSHNIQSYNYSAVYRDVDCYLFCLENGKSKLLPCLLAFHDINKSIKTKSELAYHNQEPNIAFFLLLPDTPYSNRQVPQLNSM